MLSSVPFHLNFTTLHWNLPEGFFGNYCPECECSSVLRWCSVLFLNFSPERWLINIYKYILTFINVCVCYEYLLFSSVTADKKKLNSSNSGKNNFAHN